MLENATKYPNHKLRALVQDVVHLLNQNWVVIILHVQRNANELAHCLTKYGIEMMEQLELHYTIPHCVKDIYAKYAKRY